MIVGEDEGMIVDPLYTIWSGNDLVGIRPNVAHGITPSCGLEELDGRIGTDLWSVKQLPRHRIIGWAMIDQQNA